VANVVSLVFVFWLLVILFGVIGAMRGWAKEILVSFSMILALTFITLMKNYIGFFITLRQDTPKLHFGICVFVVGLLVFFGYQTPSIARLAPKMAREKLQDVMLGAFFGLINGFLIVGSLWFFMYEAKYPFPSITDPEVVGGAVADAAKRLLPFLPPRWLGIPWIYFAVVVCFIFVIVVFI
jgi:uncharacterized membrane protein required for colicin V production